MSMCMCGCASHPTQEPTKYQPYINHYLLVFKISPNVARVSSGFGAIPKVYQIKIKVFLSWCRCHLLIYTNYLSLTNCFKYKYLFYYKEDMTSEMSKMSGDVGIYRVDYETQSLAGEVFCRNVFLKLQKTWHKTCMRYVETLYREDMPRRLSFWCFKRYNIRYVQDVSQHVPLL